MARELVIRTRCDLCTATATRVGIRVAVGRVRGRTLDLCEVHFTNLLQPVLDALEKHGTEVKTGEKVPTHRQSWKRVTGPVQCRAGCMSAPHKTVATLENHLRRLHGLTLDEYTERFGSDALSPIDLEEVVTEVHCPEGCGKVYSTALGNRYPQQAMVSHMRGHHGLRWSPGQPDTPGVPIRAPERPQGHP